MVAIEVKNPNCRKCGRELVDESDRLAGLCNNDDACAARVARGGKQPSPPAAAPGDGEARAAHAEREEAIGLARELAGYPAREAELPGFVIQRLCAAAEILTSERAAHEKELSVVIDQRDRYHDAADELAYAIASIEDIGEHTSANYPWRRAVEHLESERAAHAAEVERLRTVEADASAVNDRIATILDEAVSMMPVMPAQEALTLLEEHVHSLRMAVEIAQQREPTQAEGDAHAHRPPSGAPDDGGDMLDECFVPAGGWSGRRCRVCRRWTWGGPTACAQCLEVERLRKERRKAVLPAPDNTPPDPLPEVLPAGTRWFIATLEEGAFDAHYRRYRYSDGSTLDPRLIDWAHWRSQQKDSGKETPNGKRDEHDGAVPEAGEHQHRDARPDGGSDGDRGASERPERGPEVADPEPRDHEAGGSQHVGLRGFASRVDTDAAIAEHQQRWPGYDGSAAPDHDRACSYLMIDDFLDSEEDDNVRRCYLQLARSQQKDPEPSGSADAAEQPNKAGDGSSGPGLTNSAQPEAPGDSDEQWLRLTLEELTTAAFELKTLEHADVGWYMTIATKPSVYHCGPLAFDASTRDRDALERALRECDWPLRTPTPEQSERARLEAEGFSFDPPPDIEVGEEHWLDIGESTRQLSTYLGLGWWWGLGVTKSWCWHEQPNAAGKPGAVRCWMRAVLPKPLPGGPGPLADRIARLEARIAKEWLDAKL